MTCYQPDSSKTLFFDLNPKGAKSGKPGWAKLLGHTVECRRHGLLWARTAGAHCGMMRAQTPVRARTANMPPTWGPIYIEMYESQYDSAENEHHVETSNPPQNQFENGAKSLRKYG